MKKVLSIVLAACMLLSLAACSAKETPAPAAPAAEPAAPAAPAAEPAAPAAEPAAPAAEAITLRLTSDHTEDYVTSKAVLFFADQVKEKTNGAVVIQPYFNSVLGSNNDALEQVQYGGIDIALCSVSLLAQYDANFNALQMPFIYRDSAHFWAVLDSEIGDSFLHSEVLNGVGMDGLCWLDGGSRNFYTAQGKEVKTAADIKGLSIRVQNSALMMGMITAMGGNPVPMDSSEIYSSLQTGLIDGAENNMPFYISQSHYEVAPNFILDEHTRAADTLMMSKITIDKLTPEQMEIIRACALEASQYQRQIWAEQEAASQEEARGLGVNIVKLTPEEKQTFMDAVKELNAKEGASYITILDAIAAK